MKRRATLKAVHLRSKAPSEEEIEICALGYLFKVGGFADVEPQNDHPPQTDPRADPETPGEPSEIIFPGISRIEKQSSPYALKGKLANGKTDGENIYKREPQLVAQKNEVSTIECPSIVASQRPTSTHV